MIATRIEAIQLNDLSYFFANDNPLTNSKPMAVFVATGTATFVASAHALPPNSTERTNIPTELVNQLSKFLATASEEIFEDGIMSQLAKGLIYLVEAYGEIAVQELARQIITKQIDGEVASEALQWMGRIDHQSSHTMRLWLLERALFCGSMYVRDGAGLGTASLNDPAAIPFLRRAIAQEKNSALREDLEQVLSQLEGVR